MPSLVLGDISFTLGLAFLFFQPLLLLLLFLKDEVVSLQMVRPGLGLLLPALHIQHFGQHILHLRHISFSQLVRLAGIVVHPVPYDVGVIIRLPGLLSLIILIVSLVPMDVYLDGFYAPPLFYGVGESL